MEQKIDSVDYDLPEDASTEMMLAKLLNMALCLLNHHMNIDHFKFCQDSLTLISRAHDENPALPVSAMSFEKIKARE